MRVANLGDTTEPGLRSFDAGEQKWYPKYLFMPDCCQTFTRNEERIDE